MTRARSFLLVIALPALLGVDVLKATNRNVEQGNARFKAGKSDEALKLYDKALETLADPQARAATEFNRGVALSALEQHDEASRAFLEATKSKDTSLRARAFYNLGNTFFKGEKFGEAVEAYKRSLVMDPVNTDAKWNLELALRRKRDQDEKQKDDKQKQNDQKQNEQKQNEQKQNEQQDGQNQEPQDRNQNQPQQDQDPKPDEQGAPREENGGGDDGEKDQQQPPDQEQTGDPADKNQPQQPQDPQDIKGADPPPPEPAGAGREDQTGGEPANGAPDMREINAILDSLERSPHELERQRARVRSLRRRPPVKDW